MKTYTVEFWYYGDLRCDWVGRAYNSIQALSLALVSQNMEDWPIQTVGFKIVIRKP